MKTIHFSLLLLSLILTPLLSFFDHHGRFFDGKGFLLMFFAGIAIVAGVGIDRLARSLSPRIEGLLIAVWIGALVVFFTFHSDFLRLQVPHYHVMSFLIGALLAFTMIVKVDRDKLRQLTVFVAVGIVAGNVYSLVEQKYYSVPSTSEGLPNTSENPEHIVHIVFDMFSFEHTLKQSAELRAHSDRLAEKYDLSFHERHFANFMDTSEAVPSLLRGQDNQWIFQKLHDQGYRIDVFGESLPYCTWFGRWAHKCLTTSSSQTFATEVSRAASGMFSEFSPPLHDLLSARSLDEKLLLFPVSSIKLADTFIENFRQIKQSRANSYTFLHLVLPHGPFLIDENCQRSSSPYPEDPDYFEADPKSVEKYIAQSHCALNVLDRILAKLRSLGMLQNTRLAVHSDHGRLPNNQYHDLESTNKLKRNSAIHSAAWIPMWTKVPRQNGSRRITYQTENSQIQQWLLSGATNDVPLAESIRFKVSKYINQDLQFVTRDGFDWVGHDSTKKISFLKL